MTTRRRRDDGFDHLLLSDVHLGSDIVPHLRPWAATSWLLHEAEVDAPLCSLLEHYRTHCAEGRRWRVVLAGDFLDLVGVSLSPKADALRTAPTPEERRNGLGSAADHVVEKVRAIAERHPRVLAALAHFVAEGHELVIVRGNHDIELHWWSAQRALVDALLAHADPSTHAELTSRIKICPWFFVVPGLLYVEHGHEFDPLCSYGDPLMPTCVRDPRRIRSVPFSVLLRQVVRPTRGLSSASYDYVGMGAYAGLLANLGLLGSVQIAGRYARASHRLVSECFARAVDGGLGRMKRASARLKRFARKSGVSEDQLVTLRGLYVKPSHQSVDMVVRSLYLDRMAALLLAGGVLGLAAYLMPSAPPLGAMCALPAVALGGFAIIGRGSNTSPKASLQEGAARIAELFQVRWVVMGHTHEPVDAALETGPRGARYVNLGSWGRDDPPDERTSGHESTRTFLVLRRVDDDHAGTLMRWDPEAGPLPAQLD